MAVNGMGTTTYGKRDFLSDGSFVTTKWVVFLWIPILPLSSMRVKPVQQSGPDHLGASLLLSLIGIVHFRWSPNYVIRLKRGPDLRQVLYVYAFVLALGFAWWSCGRSPNVVNIAGLCLLPLLPFILRKVARSRADTTMESESQNTLERERQESVINELRSRSQS